jgi:hypothetical protein
MIHNFRHCLITTFTYVRIVADTSLKLNLLKSYKLQMAAFAYEESVCSLLNLSQSSSADGQKHK